MRVLSADDLVPDEPLGSVGAGRIGDGEDLLHHRILARRVAELAVSSEGKVNIALFGPWGSGKSSFNALLGEELGALTPKTQHVTFDAWKNAGSDFRTNFLYALAEQVKADVKLSEQLFQSSTSVAVPILKRLGVGAKVWHVAAAVTGFVLAVFVGLPALWTLAQVILGSTRNYLALLLENAAGFASMAAGGTLLLIVVLALVDLSKVTVSRSTPSHVAQFGIIFQKILSTKKNNRFVIFIDELDRCSATDVMTTLEGLRTFLGDPRCVFVVAFDREAVAATIAKEITHKVPTEGVAPYYRTSGEYLDKIFQFQLALPPQPVHTFRRFANSLVQERGGVWGQLRAHNATALERVVSILSPMHLASPRRTKVLLNDFAVNARVYEGMGFDWLDRAEEIAVLTVLQTEFPRLAADLEREPALMRFLYREEVPTRQVLIGLVGKYSGSANAAAPLDQIVGKEAESVAEELQENLQRYFRRLRELHVPEPRADLIMMHSDGALLSFTDPGVFHELLSAADTPREDIRAALAGATRGDKDRAIRYLLEQTERESSTVAHGLLVLVGELAADADDVDRSLARLMSGRIGGSTYSFGTLSLTGYAVAAAVAYSKAEIRAVLDVAKQDDNADVPAVISRTVESLADDDWADMRRTLLSEILPYAVDGAAAATSDVLMRFAQDVDADLPGYVVSNLALALSAEKPGTVEPESATTAAKAAADARNTELQEAFEAERDRLRVVAEEVTDCWVELPSASSVRFGLLSALRGADNGEGYLDVHDALIERDIERGLTDEANDLLLTAVTQAPQHAMSRWSEKLTTDGTVDAHRKRTALERLVGMLAASTHEQVRDSAAVAAERIAAIRSEPIDTTDLFERIRLDLRAPWEEYSDSRFETQLRLLRIVAGLSEGDEDPTVQEREDLYVMSTKTAQAEDVDVTLLSRSLAGETGQFAGAVADRMNTERLWEDDNPERVLTVILAGHDRALDTGAEITPLPAGALTQVADADVRRRLVALWLATAPPVREVESVANTHVLPSASWKVFGARSTEENRAQAWNFLTRKQASTPVLQALSSAGQPMEVYADVAASVREADVVRVRERAVDRFLALPAVRVSADHARTVVKVMAQDSKRTELILGIRILKAYTPFFSDSTIRALRPYVSEWAKAGEGYVAKRDISWLITHGYVTQKSGLLELFKGFTAR